MMEEPKTLKDIPKLNLRRFSEYSAYLMDEEDENWGLFEDKDVIPLERLKQLAISHIKHMQREGRDGYYANIDEKSAIPKLMEIFNLNEEDW